MEEKKTAESSYYSHSSDFTWTLPAWWPVWDDRIENSIQSARNEKSESSAKSEFDSAGKSAEEWDGGDIWDDRMKESIRAIWDDDKSVSVILDGDDVEDERKSDSSRSSGGGGKWDVFDTLRLRKRTLFDSIDVPHRSSRVWSPANWINGSPPSSSSSNNNNSNPASSTSISYNLSASNSSGGFGGSPSSYWNSFEPPPRGSPHWDSFEPDRRSIPASEWFDPSVQPPPPPPPPVVVHNYYVQHIYTNSPPDQGSTTPQQPDWFWMMPGHMLPDMDPICSFCKRRQMHDWDRHRDIDFITGEYVCDRLRERVDQLDLSIYPIRCAYCEKTEMAEFHRKRCPITRKITCPLLRCLPPCQKCGKYGDEAHTTNTCPERPQLEADIRAKRF